MQPHRRTDWTLTDWIAQARAIERRRSSRHRYAAAERHIARFPLADVAIELGLVVLEALRALLCDAASLFGRPNRGWRGAHWSTPVIVAANNQVARLERIRGRNAAGDEEPSAGRPSATAIVGGPLRRQRLQGA
ncbi:hypothetical protein [Methylobacterium sp.]|uniref:hypothetical protein n=1 Tax=Methylobacterium sp. TaxID=409 RepID=UPI003C78EACD